MKFLFGDIVVAEKTLIGVICKTWVEDPLNTKGPRYKYEVYVRDFNELVTYDEEEIQRYMVRHKELNEEELEYQNIALRGGF